MARAWYSYNIVGDPLLPSSYFYSGVRPRCINGFIPCAIYSVDYKYEYPPSNLIYLSNNLRNYILAGWATGLAQPTGPVKKHVYMKPQGQ